MLTFEYYQIIYFSKTVNTHCYICSGHIIHTQPNSKKMNLLKYNKIVPKFNHEYARKSCNHNLINITINDTSSAVKYKAYTHSIQNFVN